MENVKTEPPLISEFKKALKERFENTDLAFLYQKLFFGVFISENDMNLILENYLKIFKKEPEDWYRQFHKSIRQTNFFEGDYFKNVNKLTEEQSKRRLEILDIRRKFRKDGCKGMAPFTEELYNLNGLANQPESVPIAAIMDAFLYSLISMDEKNELKKSLEIVFKICS